MIHLYAIFTLLIGNYSLCGGRQQEFSQKILARAQAKSVPFFMKGCIKLGQPLN